MHDRAIVESDADALRPDRDVIGVVLAESYPLLLEGMQGALSDSTSFRVLASCAESGEALRAVMRHRPDVLVMALEIRGDALRVVQQLGEEQVPTRVILYTDGADEARMLQAIRLGVKGIVLKTMSRHLLVQCVRKVHRGAMWIEQIAIARLVDRFLRYEANSNAVRALLSSRQLEIVRMVAAGCSNRQIAAELGVSDGTVKAHLHHVYQRLGVKGRLGLTLYARDKGLFPTVPAN